MAAEAGFIPLIHWRSFRMRWDQAVTGCFGTVFNRIGAVEIDM